jgi:hypothetical protein
MAPAFVSAKAIPGTTEGMGQGLFATDDIKVAQDVMVIEKPFVAVLDTPRLTDTCSGCFRMSDIVNKIDLKACTQCRTVKYCDKVCFSVIFRWSYSLIHSIRFLLLDSLIGSIWGV